MMNLLLIFSQVQAQRLNRTDIPNKYIKLVEESLNKAGANRNQIERFITDSPKEMKEGAAFLVAYMPKPDLETLKSDLLISNLKLAYKAKNEFVWAKSIPDSIFLNEVLPYRAFSEDNENWREDFYKRFSKYVVDSKSITETIKVINKNIRDEVQVDYNTKRKKADQNPSQSMSIGMASCTGLSILLVDALRSVGVPARMAGTPNWFDNRGNHSWCEVWIEGKWYFTEYYPGNDFNQSWFLADAGKADPNSREHSIYAASYKDAPTSFPAWGEFVIPAHNVTQRYINLFNEQHDNMLKNNNFVRLNIIMYPDKEHTKPEDRIKTMVDVFQNKDQIGGGSTASNLQDANEYFTIWVEKNKTYTLKYNNAMGPTQKVVEVVDESVNAVLYQK